jgi:hypothetical protein
MYYQSVEQLLPFNFSYFFFIAGSMDLTGTINNMVLYGTFRTLPSLLFTLNYDKHIQNIDVGCFIFQLMDIGYVNYDIHIYII